MLSARTGLAQCSKPSARDDRRRCAGHKAVYAWETRSIVVAYALRTHHFDWTLRNPTVAARLPACAGVAFDCNSLAGRFRSLTWLKH